MARLHRTEGRAPARTGWRSYLAAGFASCFALLFLFALIGDEVVQDRRNGFDRSISLAVNDYATSDRTFAVQLATYLGSTAIALLVCLLMAGWLLARRRVSAAAIITTVFFAAKALETALKLGFERPRPDLFPHMVSAGGYSFPSGHTMTAVITYGLLAVLVADHLRGRARLVPPLMAFAIVGIVGFSRVYLGVHYLTDVIAGVLVAGACLIVGMLAFRYCDRSTCADAQPSPIVALPHYHHRRPKDGS